MKKLATKNELNLIGVGVTAKQVSWSRTSELVANSIWHLEASLKLHKSVNKKFNYSTCSHYSLACMLSLCALYLTTLLNK